MIGEKLDKFYFLRKINKRRRRQHTPTTDEHIDKDIGIGCGV